MVEQVRVNPEEVRGYGNICEGHTLEDFIVSNSGLAKEKENVHGALTDVYRLVYSLYGLMFDFDKGNKQLYLQVAEADTLSFGFDTVNKQLYLVDEDDTGFSLGFDEDTNELYITDDAPPIVHNYTLALDSESYTTSGSLSVSATLLDDGVAVSGATVSFTGGDSAVTATTNSSGVATATVTFSASGTLTASYSNVSDTATVTVQTYLFYDACDSSSGLSNYGSSVIIRGSTATTTLSYDSTNNCYAINGSGNYHAGIPIPILDDVDNYTLEADLKCTYNDWRNKVGFCFNNPQDSTVNRLFYNIDPYNTGRVTAAYFKTGSDQGTIFQDKPLGYNPFNNWVHMKLEINGTTVKCTISKTSDGTQLYTSTNTTVSYAHRQVLIAIYCELGSTNSKALIKNIKVESL